MSGQSDLKNVTCPKCRNKNPTGAAFCGFCGADLRSRSAPPEKATMFGYVADLKLGDLAQQKDAAPAAESPAPAPAPVQPQAVRPAAGDGAVQDDAPTTAFTAGKGYIAGRYWLAPDSKKTSLGEFFRAKDTKSDTDIELILVDAATFPSPLDMERTRRELRQLQKVNNKHLLRVLDHGKHDDGRLYVVTEQLGGETLDEIISRGPLDLAGVQRLVKGIGAGLAAAQTVGIVHRDIAPHNVIVAPDGTPKVRAIGAAPVLKDHVHGTAEYLSPEQAAGRPVDQRSNIYSLGTLIFYMLTGRPPFSGDIDSVLDLHKNAEPPDLGQVGSPIPGADRVQALLGKALAKSSSRRHLTLRQFLREIEALDMSAPAPVAPAPAPVAPAPAAPAPALAPRSTPTGTGGAAAADPVPEGDPVTEELGATPAAGISLGDTLSAGAVLLADKVAGRQAPAPALAQPAPEPVVDRVRAPQVVVPAGATLDQVDDRASTMPGDTNVPDDASLRPATAEPPRAAEAIPAPAAPAMGPTAAAHPAQPNLDAHPTRPPVSASAANTVVGEMRGGERVKLRQTSEHVIRPSEPETGAAAPPPAQPQGGKGFRETMWFFKGEVESAMAEQGETVPVVEQEADAADLAKKYADDGSITDDAARRLSLRTGKTQMMQAKKVPSGHLPGEKMRAEEFIGEINKGRGIGIVVVGLIVAAVVGMVVWLVMS